MHPLQRFLGVFAFGDVEGDSLQKNRPAHFVPNHLGLAMHPNHTAVAGQKTVLGSERRSSGTGPRELGMPAQLIVRVQLAVPQHGIFQPLFLGETEQPLDLWADVKFIDSFIERGHEGDGRELLDQRAIARLGFEQLGLRRVVIVLALQQRGLGLVHAEGLAPGTRPTSEEPPRRLAAS